MALLSVSDPVPVAVRQDGLLLAQLKKRRSRVLRLGEAFLIQMNEFDLRLESDLRRLLDPMSTAPAPPRRGKRAQDAPRVELRLTPEKLAPITVPVEVF